jgi:hypothetical protein
MSEAFDTAAVMDAIYKGSDNLPEWFKFISLREKDDLKNQGKEEQERRMPLLKLLAETRKDSEEHFAEHFAKHFAKTKRIKK